MHSKTKFAALALAIALTSTVAVPKDAFAIDPRLGSAIGKISQHERRQQELKSSIGRIGQLGEVGRAAGRAGEAAHNSTQTVSNLGKMRFGCYNPFGCR